MTGEQRSDGASSKRVPKERKLYQFDWEAFWITSGPTEGSEIGWWTGRHWVAVFGDGMWSPEVVGDFRELSIYPTESAVSS